MGMMDRMMDRMIVNMSVEQKEKMMLKMMPMMMEDLDINKMMPDMMVRMGRLITPTDVGVFVNKAAHDEEFKAELGESLNSLRERVPGLAEMMRDMMPVMMSVMAATGLMDRMMKTMGSVMPVMMPMMREMMPAMMNEHMPKLMAENENMRQLMPEMMMEVMPECIDMMLPSVAAADRSDFLARLAEKTGRAAMLGEASEAGDESLDGETAEKIAAGYGTPTD